MSARLAALSLLPASAVSSATRREVVFNLRYGGDVDVSIDEFLRAIGVPPDFPEGARDFQLVKQTVEWKARARFDDVLELSIAARPRGICVKNARFPSGNTDFSSGNSEFFHFPL